MTKVLFRETMERQTKNPGPEVNEEVSVESLKAKIEELQRQINQTHLKATDLTLDTYRGQLDTYINELNHLEKKIDRTQGRIDSKKRGLFGHKQERLAAKMDHQEDKVAEINQKTNILENKLENEYGILTQRTKQSRLNKAIDAQKQTLYVGPDGSITATNPGISGTKQFNMVGKDAVAAFSEIQKDPKKFLDHGWDKTVTGGLLKYTNATPKQAQIISTVAFFLLLRKGYTALRDNAFKGSNMRTIAALFAGSWMATGMQPRQLITAFKKTGINTKTQKDFADLFDVNKMQYETGEKMQELELGEGLAETFIYGLKSKELMSQYYDPANKGFKAQEILNDFKADEGKFLVNADNPQDPANNLVLEMIAKLEVYDAQKQTPKINQSLSPYLSNLSSLPADKFDLSESLTDNQGVDALRAKFEKAKSAYRGNKQKEIQATELSGAQSKMKVIDPKGSIQCDRKKATVSAGALEVLNEYSNDDLANPEKAAEARRKLLKVPGITISFPAENNGHEATMNQLFQGDFNIQELAWLRENNNQELNKFHAEFLQAREDIYKLTGSTIQLSAENGMLYLESEWHGKDRKVQLIIPSRTELRIAGFSSSLGAGSYKELFTQGAVIAHVIAECEGSGSATERTPFTVNLLSKGIDYKKQGTTLWESVQPSKIDSINDLLKESPSRRNNLRGVTDALNSSAFAAEGTKVITRDDGKTTEIEQPTIWMAGIDLPQKFKGIKNTEGNYYTATSSGGNGVTSTDYGLGNKIVDGTTAAATAVGAGVSNARESTVNFFKGQPDKALDGDYIQNYADYVKEHPEAANLQLSTQGLKPSEKIKRKKEVEAQTAPIRSYVYGKIVDHKEFSYAFSSLYGYLLQDAKSETKEYYDTSGKPIIQKRKNKLNEIKPGMGELFNSADGLRAKTIQKGYPADIFPSDMFTDIVTRYASHCAEKQYHDNLLAQSETIVSGARTKIGDGTKKVIKDLADGTINLTGDVMSKINEGLSGVGENMGTKILGAIGALWGAGKLKTLIRGK